MALLASYLFEHEHFLQDLSIIQIYDLSLLLSPLARFSNDHLCHIFTNTFLRLPQMYEESRFILTKGKNTIWLINDNC